MFKKRIVPEHEETYIVCDICGEEINDYSYTSNGDKHFHSMYAGGKKGEVKKTCLDIWNERQLFEYRKKMNLPKILKGKKPRKIQG